MRKSYTNMMSPGSPSSESRRRRHHVSLAVAMCLFLSTAALFCNVNLIQSSYSPRIRRQTSFTDVLNASLVSPVPTHEKVSLVSGPQVKPTESKPFNKRKLNFLIAGFPKCGTTTLVHAFAQHNETDISLKEKCQIGGSNLAAGTAYAKMTEVVQDLSLDPDMKIGIKCPISLRSHRTLSLLVRHSPHTKLIIGIRHPVRFLESHYNYRITELYDKKLKANIPPIETLTSGNEWMGVSTKNARFEIPLMQLGKTNMTTMDIAKLGLIAHSAVVPNKFKVFMYSLEQMKDTNETRTKNMRQELESFLDLKHPMKTFGHENINHFVGKNAYKETIDICDDKYKDLRNEVVARGQETQFWLRNKFLKSPDVTIANREHFLELLNAWGSDPCATTVSSKPKAA